MQELTPAQVTIAISLLVNYQTLNYRLVGDGASNYRVTKVPNGFLWTIGGTTTFESTAGSGATPPLEYKVLLTQTGLNDPIIVSSDPLGNPNPFINTLSGDIVWTYDAVGRYIGTLVGVFRQDLTFLLAPPVMDNGANKRFIEFTRTSNDTIQINTYQIDVASNRVDIDGLLNRTAFGLFIYP